MLFMNDAKCSESLAELYRLLNEEDMRCGLWKRRSITSETRAGLSLVQHGYWQRAQSLFYQAMIKATQGTYNNTVPKAEMCLWEEQWLYCAGQLSQWEVLADFGKSVENYEILLDCLWKVPDWAYMKENVIPKAQVEETTKVRLAQAFFALHDRSANGVGEAENIVVKGVELALEQWWQLPEFSVQSRTPLLQQFQQLVEVQESARILLEIANGNKQPSGNSGGNVNNAYGELKDILETWRLRTPNEWDSMSVWYDLLQWRNEIYNVVIDAFKDFGQTNPQLHHLGYRDKAWNVNKLAHVARKQGLHDVCVKILDKMYGHSTMEVQRLLAVVNALLHRCYKYPTATTGEVPQSLKKELSGVCRACFSADAVNKHVEFVREYKQEFERDLDPERASTFPATLSELTERLKHWKNVLQSNVEDRFPAVLKLEEESKVLHDFHVVDVEMPGQYFTDQEVAPDHTVKLDRVGADIPIVRRHGSSFRRLTLIGSDGSQRHFIVQTSLTPNARSDERMLQIFRVRMVEDDLMYSSFLEVYEINCARHNREADMPITLFKEHLNQAISGQVTAEAVLELRLQAYNEITKNGIGGRSPNKILFAKNTGKIFQTDFHPGKLE
ncbi:hypothetical protein BHE74_00011128 [Ensete ventricosum]|nr:hypothetical protein GW17_00037819 [Ensete ventricosum]RWW80521.1 hypothetical protein BHE74_00011128 [Ensete ventricosum]RZR93135.1 hypothetical protein BHM03_00021549 [Ensete ventricosum]